MGVKGYFWANEGCGGVIGQGWDVISQLWDVKGD